MVWTRKVNILFRSNLVLVTAKGGLDDEHALSLFHIRGRKVSAVLFVCRLAAGREQGTVEAFNQRFSISVS